MTALDRIPIAHQEGPRSERAAAALVTQSGAREAHCSVILRALRERPGSTACELAEAVQYDDVEVRRRLYDLRARGDAWSGEDRRCGHVGCRVATLQWFAAGEARQGALFA